MPIDRSKLTGRKPRTQPRNTAGVGLLSADARQRILSVPGVQGLGIGAGESVVVYVSDAAARSALPTAVEGHPVSVQVTGTVRAY